MKASSAKQEVEGDDTSIRSNTPSEFLANTTTSISSRFWVDSIPSPSSVTSNPFSNMYQIEVSRSHPLTHYTTVNLSAKMYRTREIPLRTILHLVYHLQILLEIPIKKSWRSTQRCHSAILISWQNLMSTKLQIEMTLKLSDHGRVG
jgi:hypothetical protein